MSAARLIDELARAARDWQARVVVPHCAHCVEPCCRLASVVLDLDWRRVQTLYRVEVSQRAFDAQLSSGRGPAHIKKQGQTYYAHGVPCPAFDQQTRRCAVYGTTTKPPSCTDFPVYQDGDGITADLRCEAVGLSALQAHLEGASGARLRAVPDHDFPELVTLLPMRGRKRQRRESARSSS